MTNPWQQSKIDLIRSGLRFTSWACLGICGLMTAIFCVAFTGQFLLHFWRYLGRTFFAAEWGV